MSMKEEDTAIDMSTAAADGFRDGQRAAQSAHRNLLGELYQVLGALDAPDNVLDNVSAAIHDEPLPHATLLPFVVAAQSAPAGEREAEAAAIAEEIDWLIRQWDAGVSWSGERMAELLEAAGKASEMLAAWQRTQSAVVPEGWRLVPVEPTPKMLVAYMEADGAIKRWKAMLAAVSKGPDHG